MKFITRIIARIVAIKVVDKIERTIQKAWMARMVEKFLPWVLGLAAMGLLVLLVKGCA